LIIGYLRYFDRTLPDSDDQQSNAASEQKKKLNRRERRKQKAAEWAKSHPEEEMPVEVEEEVDEDELFELAQTDGMNGQKMMDDSRKDPFSVLMVSGLSSSIRGKSHLTLRILFE
jgi:hypothetical protein